jgi:hypothetical protein
MVDSDGDRLLVAHCLAGLARTLAYWGASAGRDLSPPDQAAAIRAARLLGLASTYWPVTETTTFPRVYQVDGPYDDGFTEWLRGSLGPDLFCTAWAEGIILEKNQAAAMLEIADDLPPAREELAHAQEEGSSLSA